MIWIKLPFIGIKIQFFLSQSYSEKVAVVMKVTVYVGRKLPFFKCCRLNVRLFAKVRMSRWSMFECSLIFKCSDVRIFICSVESECSDVQYSNVLDFFHNSVFVCSNVHRSWTNIRTLNKNVLWPLVVRTVSPGLKPKIKHVFSVSIWLSGDWIEVWHMQNLNIQ